MKKPNLLNKAGDKPSKLSKFKIAYEDVPHNTIKILRRKK